MPTIQFPYGKELLSYDIPENRYAGKLLSAMHEYVPEKSESALVEEALQHPIGSVKLSELVVGKKNIVLIASDHTRPVPSKVIIPPMLAEIKKGNPEARVTILIATGCHRETTREELINKFGQEVLDQVRLVIHDCDDTANQVCIGKLPSGGDLIINKVAAEADLLISEGFIEPHFFAGFSGGRKSVLPGVASRTTVLYNHNAEFINSPFARTGSIEGNPIHEDMLFAAKSAKLAFICNVVINAEKKVVYAVAGDVDAAHKEGRSFLKGLCGAKAIPSDIVISTNGGYPLDQNIYQAVKGMTAAEASVKEGGVIIMLARSNDGHGGESFYHAFKDHANLQELMDKFLATPKDKTMVDQWEAQILARILLKVSVIYVSELSDEMIQDMHMIPAHSLTEAVEKADEILKKKGIENGSILAIPDGVSVMVVSRG